MRRIASVTGMSRNFCERWLSFHRGHLMITTSHCLGMDEKARWRDLSSSSVSSWMDAPTDLDWDVIVGFKRFDCVHDPQSWFFIIIVIVIMQSNECWLVFRSSVMGRALMWFCSFGRFIIMKESFLGKKRFFYIHWRLPSESCLVSAFSRIVQVRTGI